MKKLTVVVYPRVPSPDGSRKGPEEKWYEIEAHIETWGGSCVDTHYAVVHEKHGRRTFFCPHCSRSIQAARHKKVEGASLVLTHGGISDTFLCRNCRLRIIIPKNARTGPLRELEAA